MVYRICWFAYVDASLHPRGKSYSIMAYTTFNVLLSLAYYYFVENVHIYIHYGSITIFFLSLYFSFLLVNLFSSIRIMLDILVSYLSDSLSSCILIFLTLEEIVSFPFLVFLAVGSGCWLTVLSQQDLGYAVWLSSVSGQASCSAAVQCYCLTAFLG